MKIVYLTPTQLTLQRRPISVWIVGVIFFIVGVIYLFFASTQILLNGIDLAISIAVVGGIGCLVSASLAVFYHGKILTCHFNKTTGQFTLTRSLAGSSQITCYSLREIVGVCLQGNHQSEKKLYYLCLVLDKGIFVRLNAYARPLKGGGSNFVEGQAAANSICTFLSFDSAPIVETLSYYSSSLIWRLAFARKKKLEAELDRLKQLIRQDPADVNARYALIMILRVRQRTAEAKSLFEQSKVTLLKQREFLKLAQLNEEIQKDPCFRQP